MNPPTPTQALQAKAGKISIGGSFDSSSWITDASGAVNQHLQYLPFGEDYIYQHSNSWNILYTFSGKEKDAETGYSYFGARYYDSDISVWLSVDPLSDKYPYQSAYSYVGLRPINVIDPNGEDEWELDEKGKVVNRIKNKEKDQFHIVKKNDDGVYERVTSSEAYEYKTVIERKGHKDNQNRDITFFEVKGDDNASEIFEFFGDNYTTTSGIPLEWTHAKVGTNNSGRNIIGTVGESNKTSVGHYLRKTGYTLREVNHNHPNGTDPSGHPQQPDGTPATHDVKAASYYQEKFPNVKLNVYRSRIAYPERGGYHPYDKDGYIPYGLEGWQTYGR